MDAMSGRGGLGQTGRIGADGAVWGGWGRLGRTRRTGADGADWSGLGRMGRTGADCCGQGQTGTDGADWGGRGELADGANLRMGRTGADEANRVEGGVLGQAWRDVRSGLGSLGWACQHTGRTGWDTHVQVDRPLSVLGPRGFQER